MKPSGALATHRAALRQMFTLAGREHETQEPLGAPVSVLAPEFLSAKFRNRVLERAEPL